MAARKKRRRKGGSRKKRAAKKRGSSKRRGKGQIPLKVLEKRLKRLNNVVSKRGGTAL